jgi:UDP-glucose 4,6-dehydratase
MSSFVTTEGDYEPKNVLITGGAGFIASHVVILLAKKYPNIRVINFDKLDYCACIGNLEEVASLPNYKFVKGNICSSDLVSYVLTEEKIDTIMHFAAQTHVDNSFGNSFQFTENNIMGTHVLLESAKVHGIKRFIHVSTDEVYGEQSLEQDAMHEEQVLEPTNPYAATKASAEFLAKSYHRSFGMPVIITRGNNVYGPHQFPEKLIPKFINLIKRGRPLTMHGTGQNMRNFLFVEDVARAFEIVLFRGKVGEIYNIGGTQERKNIDVARALLNLAGLKSEEQQAAMITYVPDRAFNDLRYHINSSKLIAMGWSEQMSWLEGLKLTFDWYMKYSHRYNANIDAALVAHPRFGTSEPNSTN